MFRKLTYISPSAEVQGNAGLNRNVRVLMMQLHGRFMPGLLGGRLCRVTDNPTAWARGQVRFLGS